MMKLKDLPDIDNIDFISLITHLRKILIFNNKTTGFYRHQVLKIIANYFNINENMVLYLESKPLNNIFMTLVNLRIISVSISNYSCCYKFNI